MVTLKTKIGQIGQKIGQSRFGQSRSRPRLAKVGRKIGQSRFGQSRFGQSRKIRMAKVGLAKVGLSRWSPLQEEVECLSGAARRGGLRLRVCARTVMADFGPNPTLGNRVWPALFGDRVWPIRLWPNRLWPNRLWPNRLFVCVRVCLCVCVFVCVCVCL